VGSDLHFSTQLRSYYHPMEDSRDLQNYLSGISDEQLETVVEAERVKRETKALRGAFPSHLASRINVVQPKKTTTISLRGGAYGSNCSVTQHKLYLSVHPAYDDVDATDKKLNLTLCNWSTGQIYLTGSAGSSTISVSIKYGDGKAGSAKAAASIYGDPGKIINDASHGQVKTVLTTLLSDLGGGDGLDEIGILELFAGNDMKGIFDVEVDTNPSLRKVIMEQMDKHTEI